MKFQGRWQVLGMAGLAWGLLVGPLGQAEDMSDRWPDFSEEYVDETSEEYAGEAPAFPADEESLDDLALSHLVFYPALNPRWESSTFLVKMLPSHARAPRPITL